MTIVNSVPAWADPPSPSPKEETNLQNWTTAGVCSDLYTIFTPEDPEAWCKEQSSWLNPVYTTNIGLECTGVQDWKFVDAFGKVLTMYYNFSAYRGDSGNAGETFPTITETWSDPNISSVTKVYSPPSFIANKRTWYRGTAQLTSMFNSEVTGSTLNVSWDFKAFTDNQRVWFCGFTLEDAGTYALSRQLIVEQQVRDVQKQLALAAQERG